MLQIASIIIALSAVAPVFAASETTVTSCRAATTEDFNAIPGKAKFSKLVAADFGGRAPTSQDVGTTTTPATQTARPDSSTDRTAKLCVTETIEAAPAKSAAGSCSVTTTHMSGAVSGASMSAKIETGTSVEGQWTTTKSAALGQGLMSTVNVAISGIEGVTGQVTTSVPVNNEQSKATTSTLNKVQSVMVSADIPQGATCSFAMNVTSCTSETSVQVPIVFSGYVNNLFDADVAPTGQPADNKHPGWWTKVADYALDPADLSSIMTVDGKLKSVTYGDVQLTCTGGAGGGNTTTSVKSTGGKAARALSRLPADH